MTGIEKINERIMADAAKEIELIRAEAASECEAIAKKYEQAAKDEYWKIIRQSAQRSETLMQRLKDAAALEVKKQLLAVKQEMIEKAFESAVEMLSALQEDEYVDFLSGLAAEASRNGSERIVLSPSDRTRYGKRICVMANEMLAKEGKTAALTLSEETRNIRGGVILSDGNIEVNCSLDILVEYKKNELSAQVAKIMFD